MLQCVAPATMCRSITSPSRSQDTLPLSRGDSFVACLDFKWYKKWANVHPQNKRNFELVFRGTPQNTSEKNRLLRRLTHTCAHTHWCIQTNTGIYTHMRVYIHTHRYIYKHTRIYTCTCLLSHRKSQFILGAVYDPLASHSRCTCQGICIKWVCVLHKESARNRERGERWRVKEMKNLAHACMLKAV